jgi:putative Holliday junction resolvase
MRVLGIDYGTKRIGLAVSDTEHIAAHPFKTLENKSVKKFITEIEAMIQPEELEAIVIGRPLNMMGRMTEFTKEVDGVIHLMKQSIKIPIHTIDERLTSRASEHVVTKKSGMVDIKSAQLILETYLAQEKR